MGRELLRQVQSAIEGYPRKRSLLVNDEHNSDTSNGNTDYEKEIENCSQKHPDWEPAVQFVVDVPFDTSVVLAAGTVECVMFDYISSH